jgi:hypothetical protein
MGHFFIRGKDRTELGDKVRENTMRACDFLMACTDIPKQPYVYMYVCTLIPPTMR